METSGDETQAGEEQPVTTTEKVEKITLLGSQPSIGEDVGDWFIERAKYTPLRLSIEERKLLRLLEAALGTVNFSYTYGRVLTRHDLNCLEVSEYTDKIGE